MGAGVIGDIYRLEERGVALGSYFGVRPTILIDLISGQIFPWIRLVSLASLLRLLLVVWQPIIGHGEGYTTDWLHSR